MDYDIFSQSPREKFFEILFNANKNLVVKGGERAELIAYANALEKLKNQKTYKKEKHRKKYKDEE